MIGPKFLINQTCGCSAKLFDSRWVVRNRASPFFVGERVIQPLRKPRRLVDEVWPDKRPPPPSFSAALFAFPLPEGWNDSAESIRHGIADRPGDPDDEQRGDTWSVCQHAKFL